MLGAARYGKFAWKVAWGSSAGDEREEWRSSTRTLGNVHSINNSVRGTPRGCAENVKSNRFFKSSHIWDPKTMPFETPDIQTLEKSKINVRFLRIPGCPPEGLVYRMSVSEEKQWRSSRGAADPARTHPSA